MCGTANITIKNGSLVNTVSKDGSDVTPSIAHALDISGGTVALEKVELTSGRGQDGEYTSALYISGGSLTVTGSTAPDLSRPEADKDYKVEGLIGAETLSGTVTLSYAQTPDMSKTGTTANNITGTLSNGNYEITYVPGTLTVSNRPSSSGGGSSSGGSSDGSSGNSGNSG